MEQFFEETGHIAGKAVIEIYFGLVIWKFDSQDDQGLNRSLLVLYLLVHRIGFLNENTKIYL